MYIPAYACTVTLAKTDANSHPLNAFEPGSWQLLEIKGILLLFGWLCTHHARIRLSVLINTGIQKNGAPLLLALLSLPLSCQQNAHNNLRAPLPSINYSVMLFLQFIRTSKITVFPQQTEFSKLSQFMAVNWLARKSTTCWNEVVWVGRSCCWWI